MILVALVFLPLAGAGLLALVRYLAPDASGPARWLIGALAFVTAAVTLALTLALWFLPAPGNGEVFSLGWEVRAPWIPQIGAEFLLGADGLSVVMLVLTAFLTVLGVLYTFAQWNEKAPSLLALLLALEAGMLGVFVAADLFLFFVFWEAMLVPMYFLIGIHGGAERVRAAMKFVLFTMAGSALMLAGILALYWLGGAGTFEINALYRTPLEPAAATLLFFAFLIAFAVKVPLVPLHTWLPLAHTEAPTVGSAILAGVLLKMGTYGIFRLAMPLFPQAAFAAQWLLLSLSVIGIIYGALLALAQSDVKKAIAYSSVSHLGFVTLGLASYQSAGVQGGLLQMVNHGLTTGGLFIMVGLLYERTHTRLFADHGGLQAVTPRLAAAFLIIALASAGLPGLAGFVGEFLALSAAFAVSPWWGALGVLGVILAALYLLWIYQRVFHGRLVNENLRTLKDLNWAEGLVVVPLIAAIVWIGVYPQPVLDRLEPPVQRVLAVMEAERGLPASLEEAVRLASAERGTE